MPYPFADRPKQRKRGPALIVSRPDLVQAHGIYWCVMITSAANPRWSADIEIADCSAAGLPALSVIRPAKPLTLDGRLTERAAGRVPGDTLQATCRAIGSVLAA